MQRPSTILSIATAAVFGLVAYAVYFDYRRRNDADFRKKLRREKKRIDKSASDTAATSSAPEISEADLRAALEEVKKEEPPTAADAREVYFMSQVGMGEQLAARGSGFHLQAAMSFYRALRVYPSPVELIMIYQNTVPPAIFKIVMELTNLDVKDRVEGYYDCFPAKSMNVSVQTVDVPDASGQTMRKKILTVNKPFKTGDLIYTEQPVVTALDSDLQGKGTHCSYCLRHIEKGMAIRPDVDPLASVYCSKDCQLKSSTQSQTLLFSLDPPLPTALAPPMTPQANADRAAAQAAFVAYLHSRPGHAVPLLAARLIARQVAAETAKMAAGVAGAQAQDPLPVDGGDYTLYDHLERLRYLEVEPSAEEMRMLRDVLQTALPGLEQFVTDERHATMLGKVAYNMYGVCFGGGRADRPVIDERPEDVEKTRTPYGTARQIGSGFYLVSSYISHSCSPSARPSFSSGTAELSLIATRDLKEGDEVTVAYVDVQPHPEETPIECRRRRRTELARGWRFACSCSRCVEEGTAAGAVTVDGAEKENEDGKDEDGIALRDESKVEEVTRVENVASTGSGPAQSQVNSV